MEIQKRIIVFVSKANWFLFIVASLLCFINTPHKFALGILFGGLIVTVNFHLLKRTLKKSFTPLRVLEDGRNILRVAPITNCSEKSFT